MLAKLAVAAAAAMTLAGCSGTAVGTAAQPVARASAPAAQTNVSNGLAAVASTYSLVAIDGHALPFAPAYMKGQGSSVTQVVSGTLTLQANGTFAVATKYREVEAKGVRLYDGKFGGSCAQDGDGYRMFAEGGGETVLTVSGDTATVDNEGILFRYLRQR